MSLWVERDDVRISTEVFPAAGSTCLLVAGAGAISEFWPGFFCEGLASRGHQVIRYDHRDTGNSTHVEFDSNPYRLSDLVGDAMAVLDAHGVEAAHIVGHSMGGFVAQLAVIETPSRVLSLTSMSSHTASPAVPPPPERTWEVLLAHQPVGRIDDDLPGFMDVWRFLNADQPFDDAMAEGYTRELYLRNPTTLPANNHVAIQADMADRTPALREAACPSLVIHGDLDPLVPIEGGLQTAEALDGSRMCVLPSAGHMFFDRGAWAEIQEEIVRHIEGAAESEPIKTASRGES